MQSALQCIKTVEDAMRIDATDLLILNVFFICLYQSELQELSTNEPEPPQYHSSGPPPAKRASPQPPHTSGMYPCTSNQRQVSEFELIYLHFRYIVFVD